jgi:hypothetical protein
MRKIVLLFSLVLLGFLFQYCSSSKKVIAAPKVSYASVQPVIMNSCSPCHTGGKQKSLNNYITAKDEIDEIITRIQKQPTEKGFMPMKHPKLADSTIQLFVRWKNDGLSEK